MKVLLALDGSAPSLVARDLVGALPWPRGTEVHAVTAYDVPIDWTGGMASTMAWVGEIEDAVRDEAVESLGNSIAPLSEAGLTVERHALRGRAANVIIDAAQELEVDLIVTGSRGRGPLRAMLLGSVAAEVAAHAPAPVLIARSNRVARLLVATDGSECAQGIPPLLASWGIFGSTPADALAVNVPDSPAYELMASLYALGDEQITRERLALAQRADHDATAMAQRLEEAGMPSRPLVRSGDAAEQILAAASETEADLIVTGSRGLGGLERLILGSVARNVLLHARASVLIARPRSMAGPDA